MGQLADKETRFYSQLAGMDRRPKSHGSAFRTAPGRFVLVLDASRSTRASSPTHSPAEQGHSTPDSELLARGCMRRSGAAFPKWLVGLGRQAALLQRGRAEDVGASNRDKSEIPVAKGDSSTTNIRAVARLIDAPPHPVMHGDAHPGNVTYALGGGNDWNWQAVRRGHPTAERNHPVTSMTTADRRASERNSSKLQPGVWPAQAVPARDRYEMWDRYRTAPCTPTSRVITAGMGGMHVENLAMEG